MFRTQPGPGLLSNGIEMQPTSIIRVNEGHEAHQLSSGLAAFAAMSLPIEAIVSAGATIAGCDLTPPLHMLSVTPPLAAMAKLQRLHAAAGHLAEDTPEIIANPEAVRGLERR